MTSKHTRFDHLFRFSAFALITLVIHSCAIVRPPEGGPKDETPPVVRSSTPQNFSTNFSGQRLEITFDEYILLDNPESKILVSPLLDKKPEIKLKGRSIIAKFDSPLKENTTYKFFFGDAITDLNEQNIRKNFSLVFSTGSHIDSLSLSGEVKNSIDFSPAKDAIVMLHAVSGNDSLPMLQKPIYATLSDESGKYTLSNIATGSYKLYALMDKNSDFIYTAGGAEQIAFTNPPITIGAETITTDLLLLFPEPDSTQQVLKKSMLTPNKLMLAFRYPIKNHEFKLLNGSPDWAFNKFSDKKDTAFFWIKPPISDTLKIEFSENKKIIDTIVVATASGLPKTKKEVQLRLSYQYSLKDRKKPLQLTFANPIAAFDSSKFSIVETQGSTAIHPKIEIDKEKKRDLNLYYAWQEDKSYQIIIEEAAVNDVYGLTTDSSQFVVKLSSQSSMGTIKIQLIRTDFKGQALVQLLNQKNEVLMERICPSSGNVVEFSELAPGKYTVRAILDENSNGKWDTGIFLKQIQPEKIAPLQKILDLISGWEFNETIEL